MLWRSWQKDVAALQDICNRLHGTFVPDDDERVFACVVSDRGVTISYFRDQRYFLTSLAGAGVVMSSVSREPPEAVVGSDGSFVLKMDEPKVAKIFTVESD